MPVSDAIRELVERFEQNREAYRSSKYNETQLRREFLDPFFKALGWDVDNKQGYAEAYKDVIHEDSLEIEGETKAPDYAFRIGCTRKFFLEAKKPAVNIQSDIHPAFQLRRYAWSAKLPLSILSDFEEFAVYDCRGKPDKNDQASTSRVMLLTYRDYIQKWDEIAAVFSRDAVLKGSFDKYAEGMKGKKGTTEVDDAFLAEIERWRDLLARNIAIRNPDLTVRELNYAVQMTIDRIIFLRICEDRGVERDGQLKEIATGEVQKWGDRGGQGGREGVYSALCQLFQKADARYNSGLFHFKDEKEQSSAADSLTLGLQIDDKILKDIIGNLYYPDSPYVFKVISSDILGQVYERFLGKVIRLTAGHQAKVEEKPEVRKAGGVFYTPTFIVDYIVINTLGKLLDPTPGPSPDPTPDPPSATLRDASRSPDGKHVRRGESMTPREAARLKILDPACGSGTFLLSAYQYLLDWHLKWYMEHELEKWAVGKNPAIYQTTPPPSLRDTSPISACASAALAWPPGQAGTGEVRNGGGQGGGWKLTTARKKEILLNNIFGVDIDPQAVEVTKLSLLLKVLEGESNETIGSQLALFQERVLPDLGRNIQCGNSLIGFDYFEGRMFVEQEERERVNAFDWQAAFPQVFSPHRPSATSPKSDWGSSDLGEAGRGFDVVIGNPPYIRIQAMQEYAPTEVEYYKKRYQAASKGNYDIYVVFVEKGLSLLNEKGRLGFILPHKFFNAQYGEPLRGVIANGKHLAKVVHFGDQQVFESATTYTCLMFLDKAGNDEFEFVKVQDLGGWRAQTSEVLEGKIKTANVSSKEWNFTVGADAGLFEKFFQMPVKLGDVAKRIFQGFKTGADPVFILEERGKGKFYSNALKSEISLETTYLRPLYKSGAMKRYTLHKNTRYVIFPYNNGSLIDWNEISIKAPKTAEYLKSCKEILAKRENGRWVGSQWYCYSRNQALEIIASPKILTADLNPFANYCYDESGEACFPGGAAGGYGIVLDKSMYLYVLGLLNSKAVDYYHKKISTNFRGGWFGYDAKIIRNIPIRPINFSDPADKTRHDKMVSLVERMLALHKQSPRTPQEQEMVKREIESTDGQIDRLVYELYGLTEEEIKIVEGR